jgi:3-methyladenine DNA glycosylase AlkD
MQHEERKAFIDRYVTSTSLWENRIIVVACHYEIKRDNEKMLFYVARALMGHSHDLIHKAIGWMLREVGKRDKSKLSAFLDEYAAVMPRTMLRYALEHYVERERKRYMAMRAKKKSPA